MKHLIGIIMMAGLIGCASGPKLDEDTAALYSYLSSEEVPIPVVISYSVIYKVDGRFVPYDENPVLLKAGMRNIGIKRGNCLAPIVTIACDFQPKTFEKIKYKFEGGKSYRLTTDGQIIELTTHNQGFNSDAAEKRGSG